jgi:UDP-glucuronate 4-epimerase
LSKKILITGCAGFIGSHLFKLLEASNDVIGIDNFNNYYDSKLKKDRIKLLKGIKNIFQIDLNERDELESLIKKNKINVVIHLAAQAGVRYSLENPSSYIKNNINGTFNLLDILKDISIDHLLLASCSSVYGFNETKIFSEKVNSDFPASLYSASKKSTEVIAHSYSHNYLIPITVFRFFTVYGPWGRPDMALYKFTDSIIKDKPINIYNEGKMWRDFTYIDDLTESIMRLINLSPNKTPDIVDDNISKIAPYRILNIGNEKAIELDQFIKILEKVIGKKAIKNYLPMQNGDVPYTFASSELLEKLTGFKPNTDLEYGVKKFFDWYLNYYKI